MIVTKSFFNKAISILMVFIFLFGLVFVPPQVTRAAAPDKEDLLKDVTLTSGGNVKVSSEHSTNKAIYANSHNNSSSWQAGSKSIFPTTGTSSLWLAVDLGADKTLDEVSFDIPTSFSNVNLRMSEYEVLYASSSNANAWSSLPAANNNCRTYDWSANSWSSAKKVTTTDPNWTSPSLNNTGWTGTSVAFTPVTARYVMIHFTLISGNGGTIGMSNLRILNTPTSPTLTSTSGSYYRKSGSTLSTTINLNGGLLSGITTANAVYLAVYSDYNIDPVTGGKQTVSFTNNFLESLPNGSTPLTLNFSGGFTQTYTIDVIDPIYADTYLNNPGSGYAIITPSYPGMSLTIGQPAVIDANAASGKFPVFNVINASPGTSITGILISPNGTTDYTFPSISVDAGGSATMSIPDTATLTKGTYKAAFTLTNNGNTLYDTCYFTAIDDFANYSSIPNVKNSNNANVANVNPDSPQSTGPYPAIQMDASGKIIYIPDYKGNQIMDYSAVGYKGGGTELPNVPVRIRVSPLEDCSLDAWQTIQDAIDYVSDLPVQPDGYRGAVYLEEGVFRISKPLTVTASGVVIRGAGPGTATPVVGDGSAATPFDEEIANEEPEAGVTKLISTWRIVDADISLKDHATTAGSPYTKAANSTLINFIGGPTTASSIATTVTDQYVGAGQYTLHVASVTGLAVGDTVSVQKAVDANWARAMYMDYVDGKSNWVPGGSLEGGFAGTPFDAERTIKAIDTATKTITLAEPLSDNLDMRWGVSRVVKITEGGRMTNVGVENIQGISHFYDKTKPALNRYGVNFNSYNDENHPEVFVSMVNVRDGFMRNFLTYHIDTAFVTDGSSRNITVQDGKVLDPVSLMNAGERRYSTYYKNSQFMFTQRVYSRYMRHAFIVDSLTSGPNVFYNCWSEYVSNASEPHFRWSSGGLYDNVLGRIYIQNRWDMGTSHGWSGVNYLLYNCTGPFMVSQPQLSPVYLIGHSFDNTTNKLGTATDPTIGRQKFDKESYQANLLKAAGLNGGKVPNFPAYEYSVAAKVTPAANNMPESIYVQQLTNSHGVDAAANIAVDTVPPMIDLSGGASIERPKLVSLSIDNEPVADFKPGVYSYTYNLPLDYTVLPTITATADPGVTVSIAYPTDVRTNPATVTLTDAKGMTSTYKVKFDAVPKSPIITASGEQTGNYAINVLNTEEYKGPTSVRWAADSTPWIRMYVGETAKTVSGIQIGFVQQATSERTYKVRLEYSTDGRIWTSIPSGTMSSDTEPGQIAWSCNSDEYFDVLKLNAGSATTPENTLQSFTFDTPVTARFIRVWGNGNMTGTSKNAWNNIWRLRPLFNDGSVYTPPTGLTITGPTTLDARASIQLTAQVAPATTTVTDVIWTSSDPSIATVDTTGKVTAVAPGNVTITATTADGVFVKTEGTTTGVLQQATSEHSLTVTQNPPSGGGSSGTGGGTPAMTIEPKDGGATIDVKVNTSEKGTATIVIPDNVINPNSDAVSINIDVPANTTKVAVTIPAKDVASAVNEIKINSDIYSIKLPLSAVAGLSDKKEEALKVVVDCSEQNKNSISEEALKKIGDNAIYNIGMYIGDTKITSFNNQKAIEVAIPFKNEQKQEQHKIIIYHLNDDGKAEIVPNGVYNENAGSIKFKTSQLSKYSIGYNDVTFSDIQEAGWAKKNIEAMAAREVILGTGNNLFKPNNDVSRAEFVAMLVRTFGLMDNEAASSYKDVDKDSWYYSYIATAEKLGLVSGKGEGLFEPGSEITREEMTVLVNNFATKYKVELNQTSSLEQKFADSNEISAWAANAISNMQKAGIINGLEGNKFAPKANLTRAQAAAIIYRLLGL